MPNLGIKVVPRHWYQHAAICTVLLPLWPFFSQAADLQSTARTPFVVASLPVVNAEAETFISGVVSGKDRPVAGVLVYIFGLGTCRTDSNGRFSIGGAQLGFTYDALVQKSGVVFPTPRFSIRGGESVMILGTDSTTTQPGCVRIDNSAHLNESGTHARAIKSFVDADIVVLKKGAPAKAGSSASRRTAKIFPFVTTYERALAQFNSYLTTSSLIPEVLLRCSGVTNCVASSIYGEKVGALQEIGNLRREAYLVNRVLRLRGQRKDRQSRIRIRAIRKLSKFAFASFARFSDESFVCP